METVDIDLVIKTANSASTLKEIKTQLSILKAAMVSVGKESDEFNKMAQAAADLQSKLGDVNSRMAAFSPGGFDALTSFAGKAAGAVGAVSGAMSLFGEQSEDTQKALLKVQSAMAMAQGLEALKGLGEAFTNLKGVAVKAFQGIKAAIGSTGIGLILIAAAALYAYWDDIKAAVSGVSKEQKKLLADTQASAEAAKQKLDAISKEENILKLNGMSEREILQLKIAQTKETITALEAQIVQQEAMKKSQVEAAQRNKDILQGIIRFITSPITILLGSIDLMTEKLHEWGAINDETYASIGSLEEKFSGGIAELVFDPEEVASEADAAIEETKNKLTELKNEQAGFQLAVTAIDKQAAEERAKLSDAELEADIERMRILAEQQEDARRRDLERQQFYHEQEEALREAANAKRNAELEAEQVEVDKFREMFLQKQQDSAATAAAFAKDLLDRGLIDFMEYSKAILQIQKETDAARQASQLELAGATISILSSLAGFAKQGSKAQKSLALTQIAAETAVGFIKGLVVAQTAAAGTGPAAAFAFPIFYAQQVAAVLAAAKKAKDMLNSGGSGGGGMPSLSSGGGGIAAINTPPAQPQPSTQLDQDGNVIGGNGNQSAPEPMRVYVVESDITRTQNRVAVAEQSVSFR